MKIKHPNSGFALIITLMVSLVIAMMLGGMGSLPGAILGGLILGIVETQSLWYLGNDYRDLSAYFLLFLVLIIRPGGIFGHALSERERAALRRV